MGKNSKTDIPRKAIRKVLKRIAPDLEELLRLIDETDVDQTESVSEELIRSGARNLLIAKKIIKDRKGEADGD